MPARSSSEARPAQATPAVIRLTFPPESRLLATVRLVVGILARKAGLDDEGIEDLKVAVSETCAVAVGDLERAGLAAPIELDVIERPAVIGIEVRDRASGGAPPAGRPDRPELDDRQFSLALVGALVDDLSSTALEGGGHSTRFSLPLPATALRPRPA